MTGLPAYTTEDFGDAFQESLPTGPIWPREPGTMQRAAIDAWQPTYARSWAVACEMPAEALPSTTQRILPEWEMSTGLPDPCAGPDQTIEQRQRHVVARLTQFNGPSIPSLTAFAAALGYTITIQEFAPARAGLFRAGQPLYGRAWAFAWEVHAPAITIQKFSAGQGRAGDPLETYGNLVLVCELQRLSPAHTTPFFAFGS